MVSPLFFYQLTLISLVWLCLLLHWMWPSDAAACPTIPEPRPPRPKRTREPTPFAGLTTKPPCDACEHSPHLGCRTFLSCISKGYGGFCSRLLRLRTGKLSSAFRLHSFADIFGHPCGDILDSN